MDGTSNENESLRARIQQLEHERDELHKDIEQLCMQQAGPGYLSVATKMHFQRTAALEQEIEGLKKRLAACTRENQNLQEELSEAYRIKGQLADLHAAEVSKNADAEKQLKFFQSCVATAFAERDHSIMEAEKAKEKEELMAQKFNEFQKRLQDITSDCLEQKKLNDALHIGLAKQEELNNTFKKVIDKFFEIRKLSLEEVEDASWDDKCELLLHDPAETWSFNDSSTAKYISALEDELEKMRSSVDNLQSKLRLGLEIENHLKKAVRESENKIIRLSEHINHGIAELWHCHSQHRVYIVNLLDDERSNMKSVASMIEEKVQQFDMRREHDLEAHQREEKVDEFECRDVHISTDASCGLVSERNPELSDSLADRKSSISEALSLALQEKMNDPELYDSVADRQGDMSEALAQALQEKVAALLLLSQQEERHLLERNVNAALQKRIEELQRNLLQVTNEKVKALMELAQLKQEYQRLQEKLGNEITQGKSSAEIGDRGLVNPEGDGRLKNLLKKTKIRRWVGTLDFSGIGTQVLNNEGDATSRKSSGMDFARLRIENATLKESIENMEHLTSSIHRLRLSVAKARDSVVSKDTVSSRCKALGDIIHEANLLKTAFGSSLPVSWSAESDVGSAGGSAVIEPDKTYGSEKMDAVCAAGLEMVELLILAAQILKDWTPKLDMD